MRTPALNFEAAKSEYEEAYNLGTIFQMEPGDGIVVEEEPAEADEGDLQTDFLFVTVSRRDIETGNIDDILGTLKHLISSATVARTYCERVDIAFEGYDADRRELWEIPEVRAFAYKLDEQFPT